ncbi:MAG: type VII secretion protein EccB [Pseudonocardiaceae bacterium]
MARNPTTKSQVQAYQFVLRRMQSALVRKDAVMLHEPMRTHLRAAAVGLIIGVLGCAGFFVFGLFSPDDDLSGSDIVVGKQSGAIYVVQQEPFRLIPVRNLASARLLLAALPDRGATAGPAEVKVVEDASLGDASRAPLTGIEGAPAYLPGPDRRVPVEWAVCDRASLDDALPNPEASPEITTTALIGLPRPGRELAADEALLVESSTGDNYLVRDGKRGPVDLSDSAVTEAYQLGGIVPREISVGLLNAIPEGDALNPPVVPGVGEPSSFPQLAGVAVGDVVQVNLAGRESFYLILRDGQQAVARAVADLIRFDRSPSTDFTEISPEAIAEVPPAPQGSRLDFGDFPSQVPRIVETPDAESACLAWRIVDGDQRTAITVSGAELPLPEGKRPVEIPGQDGSGDSLDSVFLPPSRGALVRGVVPGQEPGTGSIFLVTDQGLKYGVPSMEVAQALGLGETTDPAPEAILGLLPDGPPLEPQDALELYDPGLAAQRQQELTGSGGGG